MEVTLPESFKSFPKYFFPQYTNITGIKCTKCHNNELISMIDRYGTCRFCRKEYYTKSIPIYLGQTIYELKSN